MGVELVIAPETKEQAVVSLATTKGWADAIRHIEVLDRERYPRLWLFATRGMSADCELLADELEMLLIEDPPENSEIDDTLMDLVDSLDGRGNVPCYVGDPPDEDNDTEDTEPDE